MFETFKGKKIKMDTNSKIAYLQKHRVTVEVSDASTIKGHSLTGILSPTVFAEDYYILSSCILKWLLLKHMACFFFPSIIFD